MTAVLCNVFLRELWWAILPLARHSSVKIFKEVKIVEEVKIVKEVKIAKEVKIVKDVKIVGEVKRIDSLQPFVCGDISKSNIV